MSKPMDDTQLSSLLQSKLELRRAMTPLGLALKNWTAQPTSVLDGLYYVLTHGEELLASQDREAITVHTKLLQSWFVISALPPPRHSN
jgi:hypothetical protein